eukprot:9607122-Karenia_brevis.AAC.1
MCIRDSDDNDDDDDDDGDDDNGDDDACHQSQLLLYRTPRLCYHMTRHIGTGRAQRYDVDHDDDDDVDDDDDD